MSPKYKDKTSNAKTPKPKRQMLKRQNQNVETKTSENKKTLNATSSKLKTPTQPEYKPNFFNYGRLKKLNATNKPKLALLKSQKSGKAIPTRSQLSFCKFLLDLKLM